jgi:hypothetical protein
LYRQHASESLWKVCILVKQLFVKKGVFFHTIVQALSRQFKKIDCGSKQFVKHLTARIKNFVSHFTGNKSSKMYTNCRNFFNVFVTQMPATEMKKKV